MTRYTRCVRLSQNKTYSYYISRESILPNNLNAEGTLARAFGNDADRKFIIVAEDEVKGVGSDRRILVHGQVAGAAGAVRAARKHRNARQLADGVIHRAAALAGAAARADLAAAVDQHRRGKVAVGARVGADLRVKVE